MVEDAVRALLRISERVRATLDAVVIRPSGGRWESVDELDEGENVDNKRVLAVISHKDNHFTNELEEGSLFVCKYLPQQAESALPQLDVEHVFPMAEGFSIAMAQTRRGTIDHPGTPVDIRQQTGFILTINPGLVLDSHNKRHNELMAFFTTDVQHLGILLKDCRELSGNFDDLEDTSMIDTDDRFSWLLPYTSMRLPSDFGLVPRDLRLSNQPLHDRLSSSVAGFPGDDPSDIKLIREEWLLDRARVVSTSKTYRLRLRLGTFNVNGQFPSQDLSGWIRTDVFTDSDSLVFTVPPFKTVSPLSLEEFTRDPFDAAKHFASSNHGEYTKDKDVSESVMPESIEYVDKTPDPDMIVLGFQELDLSTEALIYSTGTAREDAWCLSVFAALGEKGVLYEKLASKQLVGILIVVLVKKALRRYFTDVQASVAPAGIMGVMGNKGGAAVRVVFTPPVPEKSDILSSASTVLTFVNAHLAAFDEMFERRNSDFQDISKKLKFDDGGSAVTIYESDILFWMGGGFFFSSTRYFPLSEVDIDLNYRVDISDIDTRKILFSHKWDKRIAALIKYDQLRKASRIGKAFVGFYEHSISHLPTYRFSPGIAVDELGYDTKRKPAWTDRILFMATPSTNPRQLSYTSHPQITLSDHRPVAADFTVDVAVYDKDTFTSSLREIYRTVERMDDISDRPILKLDVTSVDMGLIRYQQSFFQTIRVQNLGKGPCAYRFVATEPDSHLHSDWLRVEPKQAVIFPGDTSEITFSTFVDNKIASKLNRAPRSLSETLILHTLLGKDHFITVTGKFQYTCFANSLSTLTRLPGPVRSLESLDVLRPEEGAINAPREIMRLVNWMMTECSSVDDLFNSPADESIIYTIRECLDTGEDFPFPSREVNSSICLAFAESLLRLLDSLTEPVVPSHLHSKCAQVASRDEAFELLDAFPPVSVNVWISITAFLHFVSCQPSAATNEPQQRAEYVATIFYPVLLRDDPDTNIPAISPLGKRDFLLRFIT